MSKEKIANLPKREGKTWRARDNISADNQHIGGDSPVQSPGNAN